jgi:hypothetical protein
MIQQHQKEVKTEEIIEIYKEVTEILTERYEIYVGIGNTYYNNCQYLRAEEQYFLAIKIKKT